MKKTLFLINLSVILVLGSCAQTPEEKAKKLIKSWASRSLGDPRSYEPTYFGLMDSTNLSPSEKFQIEIYDIRIQTHKRIIEIDSTYSTELRRVEYLKDSILNIRPFYAYTIEHEYRAKNQYGALGFENRTFYFNKDLTEILEVVDNSKLKDLQSKKNKTTTH